MNRIAASLATFGLLLGFALGGCSTKPNEITVIEEFGGRVTIDRKSPDRAVISVDLRKSNVTDAGLAYLEGFAKLQSLNLTETQVTDAGLVHLQGLTQLQSLDLRETSVTSVKHLQGLTQLQRSSWEQPRLPTPDWSTSKR